MTYRARYLPGQALAKTKNRLNKVVSLKTLILEGITSTVLRTAGPTVTVFINNES